MFGNRFKWLRSLFFFLPLFDPGALEAQDAVSDPFEVDHLVVTGSNIRSDSPPWVPESIFSRENVERSGADSLGDFFRALPQNSGPTFTENQNDSLAAGGAAIALRGLSPDATLVLLNSRRLAPYPFAQSGITAFVDLNSIRWPRSSKSIFCAMARRPFTGAMRLPEW